MIRQPSTRWDFFRHLDHLQSSPDTGTYSNPEDLMWMSWIQENDTKTIFSKGSKTIEMFHTVVKVIQETVDGESYYQLPSKLVRGLLGITSFTEGVMKENKLLKA